MLEVRLQIYKRDLISIYYGKECASLSRMPRAFIGRVKTSGAKLSDSELSTKGFSFKEIATTIP